MKNGSIEKSAALSRVKVTLGQPAHLIGVESLTPVESSPSAVELALSVKLAECERQLADLKSQLVAAQEKSVLSAETLQVVQGSIESARVDAQRQGYAVGLERGEKAGRTEWREKMGEWVGGLTDLARQQSEFCSGYADSLVDLVLACTVKMLGEEAGDPRRVRAALEHLMDESGLSGPLTVRIAPAQYEELVQHDLVPRAGAVQLMPDSSVAYGGGVLETDGVEVDGRYEVQLQKLRAILLQGGV